MKKVALAIVVGLIVIGVGETAFAQRHTTMRAAPRDCSKVYGPSWHESMTFPKMGTWGGGLSSRTGLNGKTWYRYRCTTPRRWYVKFYNGVSGTCCTNMSGWLLVREELGFEPAEA